MCSGVWNVYSFVSSVLFSLARHTYWSELVSLSWGSVLADFLTGKLNALRISCIKTEALSWFWGTWLFPCNKFSQVLYSKILHQTIILHRFMNSYLLRAAVGHDKLASLISKFNQTKYNRVLFRLLPTEFHMLRETTSSEKQVLRSLLSTIPFRVVLINILKYLTLCQGLLEKRAVINSIVLAGVEKLNSRFSEKSAYTRNRCCSL